MINKKIISCIILLFLIVMFSNNSFAKYVIEEKIVVCNIQIDRTTPKIEVFYSTKEITDTSVEVTICANEEIKEIQGWTLQEDKKTLKKQYINNIQEIVEVQDLSGNIIKTEIKIENIVDNIPYIKIENITNTNISNPNYATEDDEISFNIIIKDNVKIVKTLKDYEIKILIDDKEIMLRDMLMVWEKEEEKEQKIRYRIRDLRENGNLKIKILGGSVIDELGRSNKTLEVDPKIQIDNTKLLTY